jgi:PAS domain S-box-containing protein
MKMKSKKGIFLLAWIPCLLVCTLLYLNEWVDLPHYLLGAPVTPVNTTELLMEIGLVLLLAIAGTVVICIYIRICNRREQSYGERLVQLRKVLDKSPILTTILSRTGVITYANDAFLFQMGLTFAEVENKPVIDFLPIEDAAFLEGKLPDLLAGTINRIDVESVLMTSQQKKIVLKAILTLLDPGKNSAGDILVFAEDITDRRSLEAKARGIPAIAELERITRDMAHEYNNKLMTILGAASLIADQPVNPEVSNLVDKIRKTAEQSIDLTRRLAAFSGKKEGTPLPLRLNRLVGSILPIIRAALPGSIRIKTDYGSADPLIHCRTALIQNALLNLAFNARDALASEGEIVIGTGVRTLAERTSFDTGELPPGEYSVISVTDTGHGIDPADRASLFQPFFTTRGSSGGLGLSSVSGAVKTHGGAVEVISEKGKGACFSLLLPLKKGETHPRDTGTASETGSGRILLVDDEELLRSIMTRMISGLGYQVIEAESGADALALWDSSGPFDAVLLDMVMPGMDGIMAAGEFLKRDSGARIMLLTGYQVEDRADDFRRAGITLAASKPINRRDLAAKLAFLVKGDQPP